MARISLGGFKDPLRRPRFIIWSGVAVLLMAAVVIVALGVTSSRWFCADGCHRVQDDTIIAYSHSSHDKISCIACHIPVNADPVTFLIHKVEAGLGVIPTLQKTFELPLNAEDEVALSKVKMPEEVCTQCHDLKNRKITPSSGIIINHEAHSKAGYQCTVCHNRVAHPEDFSPTLPGNAKHANFMEMDACFRCHGLQAGAKAPGACTVCHPKDFKLKPDYHLQAGFYPKGHAELAKEAVEKVDEAENAAQKKKEEAEGGTAEEKEAIPNVETVNTCETCHVKATFCDKCHGMEMPHSAEFKEPKDAKDPNGHPVVSQAKATAPKCEFCHHQSKTFFCDNCHHGEKVEWKFDAKVPWQQQHAQAVAKNGVDGCLGKCHETSFCKACHDKLKPVPTSHKSSSWLHGPKPIVSVAGKVDTAKPSAQHPAAFVKTPSDCAVCHGDGTAVQGNKVPSWPFCKSCHGIDLPHPQGFKEQHLQTGRANPQMCSNCHQFKELCSDCHHSGATNAAAWTAQHGGIVNKSGAAGCLEKCHKKPDCVACHTSQKVVPPSHNASNWVHRATQSVPAGHDSTYNNSPDPCTYCHGDGGAKAQFCMNCHKIQMPHPDTFGPKPGTTPTYDNGGDHAKGFQGNKLDRNLCNNCHDAYFCDSCHHKAGFNPSLPWGVADTKVNQQHPNAVKAKGPEGCLRGGNGTGCHAETYCSHCHVTSAR